MKKLSLALANILGVGVAMTVATSPALAQQTAQKIEKIEVTGSNIKRVEGESALPVTVISREEIDRTGATSAMELLNFVAANNSLGNVNSPAVIGASTFSNQTASLRGLQGYHTLVLINGKRVNGFSGEVGGNGGVNLAVIPFAAIDRVEVLKDGASAVYGSDAIAGVINFILRSDYKCAEGTAWYGQPTRSGGGKEEKYSGSVGFGDLSKDRYNVFFSASYDNQHNLQQKDRNFSDTNILLGIGYLSASSNTFPGNITTGGIGIPVANCGGLPNVFVPDFGVCLDDIAKTNGVESIPDDKNLNFFGSAKFQITNNWQAYGTALYSKDENHHIIQPSPISSIFPFGPTGTTSAAITLQPTSAFYPHDLAAAAGVDGQPLDVRYRAAVNGNRDTTDTNKGVQIVGGLKGTIANRWDTDISYNYSQGKTDESLNDGFPDLSILVPLLNSGTVNLFGPNTPDIVQQMRATNLYGTVFSGTSTIKSVDAKISGDLFNVPAGAVAGAIGFTYRKESFDETSVPALSTGNIAGYGGGFPPVGAERNVKAAFAEVNIPIVRTLEADLAVRTDDYSDFGRTNNPKVSLRWQPNRDILFRTSYGKGFLAPTLYELFIPQASGVSANYSDPIRCPVTHAVGNDCNTQFTLTLGGNPALKPEKSEQATFGIVFEPSNAFSVSANYFKLRLNAQVINGFPIPTILGDLGQYGNLVTRGPVDPANPNLPGRITNILQTYINLGATHLEGIDVETHYKWPQTSWGRLRFDLSGTYFTRDDSQNTDGTYSGFVSNQLGGTVTGVTPRWKHYAMLSLDSGPWTVSVANNYQSSYTDQQTDANNDPRTVSSMSLWDLQGSYSGFKHLTLTLGVKNVLDTNPPLTNQATTFQSGYDPSYYDARARFVYGSVRYAFK
jgi:iron complex outermembrane receptor protein